MRGCRYSSVLVSSAHPLQASFVQPVLQQMIREVSRPKNMFAQPCNCDLVAPTTIKHHLHDLLVLFFGCLPWPPRPLLPIPSPIWISFQPVDSNLDRSCRPLAFAIRLAQDPGDCCSCHAMVHMCLDLPNLKRSQARRCLRQRGDAAQRRLRHLSQGTCFSEHQSTQKQY